MPRRPEPYTSEYFLLGLIQAQPIYPYDLHKRLSEDEKLRLIWRFNQSQLYATLEKLEKAGLIWAADSDYLTFPARKVYSITGAGADRFEEWLATPVAEQRNLHRDFCDNLTITHETIFLIPFLFTCPTCIVVLHIDTFVLQCPLAEAVKFAAYLPFSSFRFIHGIHLLSQPRKRVEFPLS